MGLNANFLRLNLTPPQSTKPSRAMDDVDKSSEEDSKAINGEETDEETQKIASAFKEREDAMITTYTYFQIYDRITSELGDFYSETLAKMNGPEVINKKFLNELYNGALRSKVDSVLESAKAGEKLDYAQLAQEIKDQITATLEDCNYDWSEYQNNLIDENIN